MWAPCFVLGRSDVIARLKCRGEGLEAEAGKVVGAEHPASGVDARNNRTPIAFGRRAGSERSFIHGGRIQQMFNFREGVKNMSLVVEGCVIAQRMRIEWVPSNLPEDFRSVTEHLVEQESIVLGNFAGEPYQITLLEPRIVRKGRFDVGPAFVMGG